LKRKLINIEEELSSSSYRDRIIEKRKAKEYLINEEESLTNSSSGWQKGFNNNFIDANSNFGDGVLIATPKEIERLTEKQLSDYVQKNTIRIFEKIEASCEKTRASEEKAKSVKDMKTGFFGKTTKKVNAVADGLIATQEAIGEIAELQKEIIQFIGLTLRFHQKMRDSIRYMMQTGFIGRDGQFHEITESSKEIALSILNESEKYARSQLLNDMKNKEQDERIDAHSRQIEELEKKFENTLKSKRIKRKRNE